MKESGPKELAFDISKATEHKMEVPNILSIEEVVLKRLPRFLIKIRISQENKYLKITTEYFLRLSSFVITS